MTSPLVPEDVDLQDFAYMPLDVRRLRDSDLAAMETPESCWAAVLLWAASWHQVPAASLPDDDRVLSNLAGYGRVVSEWQKVKEGALRGWVKCSDGRLYHPVVAEKAIEAWGSKLHHAHGKLKERLRKSFGRDAEFPDFDEWVSAGKPNLWPQSSAGIPDSSAGIPAENSLKGEGEGKGYVNQEPTPTPKRSRSSPAVGIPSDVSNETWDDYLALRRAKRAPMTQTALDGLVREAAKAGITLQAVLETCCQRGWTGFKADWLRNSSSQQQRAEKFDPVAHVNRNRTRSGYEQQPGGNVIDITH